VAGKFLRTIKEGQKSRASTILRPPFAPTSFGFIDLPSSVPDPGEICVVSPRSDFAAIQSDQTWGMVLLRTSARDRHDHELRSGSLFVCREATSHKWVASPFPSCKTLSFSTSCRLIPAYVAPHFPPFSIYFLPSNCMISVRPVPLAKSSAVLPLSSLAYWSAPAASKYLTASM
jgi:hypothetical protein